MGYNGEKLILGINFGDHSIDEENLLKEIKSQTVGICDAFILRARPEFPLSIETYSKIAEFAFKNKIYFAILYAYQHPPKGRVSHLDGEKVELIKRNSKGYFLGEIFAETGSQYVAMSKGYYIETPDETISMPPQGQADMESCRRSYVDRLKSLLDYDRSIGIEKCIMIEPTATGAYSLEAGFDMLMLEMLPSNADNLIPFTRGAARAYNKDEWGALIAHEWYGGYDHVDALKLGRLDLSYKLLYLSGSNYIFIESGTTEINSFGTVCGKNSKLSKNYRRAHSEFSAFVKNNPRPVSGPKTEVAFIYGNDDGYSGFLGGSAWCQFDKEEWGSGDRERSWRILDDIYRSYSWCEFENVAYSGVDLSIAPPYGTYDVIPANTPLSVMKKYKLLIFVGHNTMTHDLSSRLTDYVRSGGTLLASAAHLNTSSERNGDYCHIDNEVISALFGVKIIGHEKICQGIKFVSDSYIRNVRYPYAQDGFCDANYQNGYKEIAVVQCDGAHAVARYCDSFEPAKDDAMIAMTEYKLGRGTAMLLTNLDYPGAGGCYPFYRMIVKQLLCAFHSKAEVKVFGSDKVRFSVFEDKDGEFTLYLLNTDLCCPITIGVIFKGDTKYYTVAPCDLVTVKL